MAIGRQNKKFQKQLSQTEINWIPKLEALQAVYASVKDEAHYNRELYPENVDDIFPPVSAIMIPKLEAAIEKIIKIDLNLVNKDSNSTGYNTLVCELILLQLEFLVTLLQHYYCNIHQPQDENDLKYRRIAQLYCQFVHSLKFVFNRSAEIFANANPVCLTYAIAHITIIQKRYTLGEQDKVYFVDFIDFINSLHNIPLKIFESRSNKETQLIIQKNFYRLKLSLNLAKFHLLTSQLELIKKEGLESTIKNLNDIANEFSDTDKKLILAIAQIINYLNLFCKKKLDVHKNNLEALTTCFKHLPDCLELAEKPILKICSLSREQDELNDAIIKENYIYLYFNKRKKGLECAFKKPEGTYRNPIVFANDNSERIINLLENGLQGNMTLMSVDRLVLFQALSENNYGINVLSTIASQSYLICDTPGLFLRLMAVYQQISVLLQTRFKLFVQEKSVISNLSVDSQLFKNIKLASQLAAEHLSYLQKASEHVNYLQNLAFKVWGFSEVMDDENRQVVKEKIAAITDISEVLIYDINEIEKNASDQENKLKKHIQEFLQEFELEKQENDEKKKKERTKAETKSN